MKRLLVCLLLIGVVGCGEKEPAKETLSNEAGNQSKQASPNKLAEQPSGSNQTPQSEPSDPVTALKQIGADLTLDEQGEVIGVDLNFNNKITDAGLVHLKGMTKLFGLRLSGTTISDAGLAHLEGLADLTRLSLYDTQITDAGLVHLQAPPQRAKMGAVLAMSWLPGH